MGLFSVFRSSLSRSVAHQSSGATVLAADESATPLFNVQQTKPKHTDRTNIRTRRRVFPPIASVLYIICSGLSDCSLSGSTTAYPATVNHVISPPTLPAVHSYID